MQDAQTSQVDGYGGMKVKFLSLISSQRFYLFFVIFTFPYLSYLLISFNFSTDKSDGEGKCLKSNPTEAWQTDFHLLYSKNLFTLNVFLQIGAASKGIIQRDFQHHATVFKSPYAKNPFDSVSNDELEEYKRIIDKKQRGETSPVIEDPGDTTDPGTFPSTSPSFHIILSTVVVNHLFSNQFV